MSFTTGLLALLFVLILFYGVHMIIDLQTAINKLETDLDGYIAAGKVKDQLLADQATEIDRLTTDNTALTNSLATAEANAADPVVVDAMTAQVTGMDGKLSA